MDKTLLPYRIVLPLLCGYVLITLLGLHNHELALEEAQFFLFGRDSDSLSALYHNMQYEGHPRLWCFLLYLINHNLSSSFIAIQVLHLLITSTTVFLFLRYAPFARWVKIGIVFSFSGGDNVEQGKEFDAAIAAYQKEHGDSAGGR